MTTCTACGCGIEFVKLQSGQRVPVNPGWVPAARGADLAGITMVRVVHWATCPGSDKDMKRIVR